MDTLSKERMHDWAEELKEMYNSAPSNFELMDCADAMADFIDEFLKINADIYKQAGINALFDIDADLSQIAHIVIWLQITSSMMLLLTLKKAQMLISITLTFLWRYREQFYKKWVSLYSLAQKLHINEI